MDESKNILPIWLKHLIIEIVYVIPNKNQTDAAEIFKIKTGLEYKKSRSAGIIIVILDIFERYGKIYYITAGIFAIIFAAYVWLTAGSNQKNTPVQPIPIPPIFNDHQKPIYGDPKKIDDPKKMYEDPYIFEPLIDRQVDASDKRLAELQSTATKWRSRTGPIHDDLGALLGSITTYDKNRFDKQPDAKEAWDYLQSIQKIIDTESVGITIQNKNEISINVNITGVDDIGDRAAHALNAWLEENGFNTDKHNSEIYIDVIGSQSSSPNPYTTYSATTSLNLVARWLDGNIAFEIHNTLSIRSGGGRDDAENRSFMDAVSKMIRFFQMHVH